ncbi:hypothetical protein Droror1_Dr00004565 [Drosera rotundifolia]
MMHSIRIASPLTKYSPVDSALQHRTSTHHRICLLGGPGDRRSVSSPAARIWRLGSRIAVVGATLDKEEYELASESSSGVVLDQEQQLSPEVEASIKLLKNAAKTRKVAAEEVLPALSVIEKAKLDATGFLETLGGSQSPGRTWMLIFAAEKNMKEGRYFPVTAVQRFDAAGKRIENGVYLGSIGSLTFEGRISWNKRILAFIFERIRIKIGPLPPLEVSFGKKDDREPNTKDPFFILFYVDKEIAVARGKSGGTAFWCRCSRVAAGF